MANLSLSPPFADLQVPLGIRDARALAFVPEIDRLNQLNIRPLLTYTIDQMEPIRFGDVAWWNDTWSSATSPGTVTSALPHLAWQFNMLGSQGWDFVASEKDRRGLIKRAIPLYRLKGTLAGFKAMAKLSGSEVLRAITPPSKIFTAPSLTDDERNDFLEAYPQLRIYKYRDRSSRIGAAAYCGNETYLGGGLVGNGFPVISDAIGRIRPRSFMVKNDIETELVAYDRVRVDSSGVSVDYQEIHKKSVRGYCSFVPGHVLYLASTDARKRIYMLRAETAYIAGQDNMRMRTVNPGMEPMEMIFREIRQQSTKGMTSFCDGGSLSNFCLNQSDARIRLYKRMHLFDPEVPVRRRGKSTHIGDGSRMSMPHHRAEIQVGIYAQTAPKVVWKYLTGHLVAQPKLKFHGTFGAMQTAQRLADRCFLDTTTKSVAKASQTLMCGDIVCGQWISTE